MQSFSVLERKLFESIEKRRAQLVDSYYTVSFMDFGAVAPNAKLSQEEMYVGKKIEKTISELAKQGLKGEWAQKLYALVRDNSPKNVLELGSCCGFSAIYMAKANKNTTVYTIEGASEVADIARSNYLALDVSNVVQIVGRFQDVLIGTLENMKKVDLVFIDGHHDKEATIKYYQTIKSYLGENAVVIFDDVNWSKGMAEAWESIKAENATSVVEDLGKLGIVYCGENL